MQSLYNAMFMVHVISEVHYKGTILLRTILLIIWSFSYDSFVKFCGKKFGSHNMTMLYPNPCYNEVCFKGTALYHQMSL